MTKPRAASRLSLTIWLVTLVTGAAQAAETGGYDAEYSGYNHGFLVLKATGSLTLTPVGYDVKVAFRTAGLVGLVAHVDSDSRAQGRFVDGRAQPSLFESSGHLRGTARATRIVYPGGNPMIQTLTPPAEQERDAVPVADTRHTIDTLSAVVLLIRQVGEEARCEGTANTFDGRRLASQSAHTAGQDLLDPTRRSIFAGQSLRCDFEGRQRAGFVRGQDADELKRPRHATAWFATVLPNAPPVPVRIAFNNKLFGQVTLYLTALTAAR